MILVCLHSLLRMVCIGCCDHEAGARVLTPPHRGYAWRRSADHGGVQMARRTHTTCAVLLVQANAALSALDMVSDNLRVTVGLRMLGLSCLCCCFTLVRLHNGRAYNNML